MFFLIILIPLPILLNVFFDCKNLASNLTHQNNRHHNHYITDSVNKEVDEIKNKFLQKYVLYKKSNNKTKKSINTDETQDLIESSKTNSVIDLNFNSNKNNSFEKQKNTKAIIKFLFQLKEWLCEIFSFYTASNNKIKKVYQNPKQNVTENNIIDSNFKIKIESERSFQEIYFLKHYYAINYAKKLARTPFSYFDNSILESKNHRVDIIIKQDYSNIGFYHEKHRILFEIYFNVKNKKFTISLPYTKEVIEIFKKLEITYNGNTKFTDLSFVFTIALMFEQCYLIKDLYHLELLKDKDYVNLGMPRAIDPDQYNIFVKNYGNSLCYDKNEDAIFQLKFGEYCEKDLIFMAMVYDIYKPFYFTSNLEFDDFFRNKYTFDTGYVINNTFKADFKNLFNNLSLINFDCTVNADKNLYDGSKYLEKLKNDNYVNNKNFLTKKLLKKKISNNCENGTHNNFSKNIDNCVINKERSKYFEGINPALYRYYYIEEIFYLSNVTLFEKSILELKDHDVYINIYEEFSLKKFYKNNQRLIFEIDLGINDKKFFLSAPLNQSIINNLFKVGIDIGTKIFMKLNFLFRVFQKLDDIYLIKDKIHLKLSSEKNKVKFGLPKIEKDDDFVMFYNKIVSNSCIDKNQDNLFAYELNESNTSRTILLFLFYHFNPFIFFTVEDFESSFPSGFNIFESIDFYEIICRFFNLDSKYHVKAPKNLNQTIQKTPFHQFLNTNNNDS
ncbi:hypothetical protein GVAV_002720 [Gurleya vavrai]